MQIVSVLALLALFTHNNLFWILALLLAAVKLPDMLGPLRRISDSIDLLATATAANSPLQTATSVPETDVTDAKPNAPTQSEAAPAAPATPEKEA
ncbi:MAG: hypothetical protein ACU0A6_12580 [Shimia sp.]|jgi:hypothetical protein|uniref:hypothetical protein n=1 Tax=Shimia sp. TaxID=1954381 RepID=UPI004058E22C